MRGIPVEIDRDETLVGIKLMRRFLLQNASGSVLEVAAGTGRNVPYYDKNVSVLLTDLSANMLGQIANLPSHIQTAIMSAEDLDVADDSFDTVVDTFALCSVDNPVQMLQEMQRVCKPNGKILLLEHGKSNYSWLTYVLDKFALKHAERWGCFWNRDILKIVSDAGLEVESSYRFHFGTTEFGIDYEAFRTADKFRGVKLIPPGLHFIFYASNGDNDNGHGIRQGFFVEIKPNDVVIRTWSSETEELVPMTREADIENLTRAVHGFQLDGNLGAYPQKHAKSWHRLSKYITKDILAKCGLTVGGTISPGDPDAVSLERGDAAIKPFFPDVAQVARFTRLTKPTSQRVASDLTRYHVGTDFFQDELATDNFIKASLASLFEILHDDTLDDKRAAKLKQFLKDRFQLQFDVMGTYCFGDDDSAPAVILPDQVGHHP
ncbi:hypothetical protein DYB32_003597 [Aphanomyces invadans]|uniref:Methyltransferase type 11 domain-containing protein n=1 Tax=Aphanomyces invadans TaxID=157072 RepID=A0A418B052_9STRA|nr:hypothetical protein DYB32_003597 [Aphanomyces invadans]